MHQMRMFCKKKIIKKILKIANLPVLFFVLLQKTNICIRFAVSGGVSSPQVTTVTYTEAEVVQYATSISINIRLQKGTTLGKIYPPYLTITYGNVKLQDKNSGKKVAVRQVVTIPLMNYLIQILIYFPFGGDDQYVLKKYFYILCYKKLADWT